MTQGERVRELRQSLSLTLEKFGQKIGVGKSTISDIENNRRSLTEHMTKSICREFNVDYIWLTTGEGEMFLDNDEDFIIRIEQTLTGESSKRKNMFKALLDSSEADIEALDRILSLYAKYESEEQGKS